MASDLMMLSRTPAHAGTERKPFGKHVLRVLLTSAGRRVELLQCFRAAAAELKVDLQILACDLTPELSSACHQADQAFAVPRADDPSYIEALLNICADRGVRLVVPTIDTELLPLSHARADFEAIGAEVSISDPDLVALARDKLATANFFVEMGVPSPRTVLLEAGRRPPTDWSWPSVVKPRHGSASRGLRIAAAPHELPTGFDEPFVLQERLIGAEFTVNLFFDRDGRLRCAIPHERLQVRAGEVEKGRTKRVARLGEIARQLAAALPGPRGALCFQAILGSDGEARLFEINARFGGGYPLAHRAGAAFARWLIEERLGWPSSADDDWRENVVMLRYDAAVFVGS